MIAAPCGVLLPIEWKLFASSQQDIDRPRDICGNINEDHVLCSPLSKNYSLNYLSIRSFLLGGMDLCKSIYVHFSFAEVMSVGYFLRYY